MVNMTFLANKSSFKNSHLMLVIVLFLSVLACGKSISLNLPNSVKNNPVNLIQNYSSLALGEVQVKAEFIPEKIGTTAVTAEPISEPVTETIVDTAKKVAKLENYNSDNLVQARNIQPTKPVSAAPVRAANLSFLSIPSIGLSTSVGFATVQNLPLLEKKLLHNPLIESVLSSDFCLAGKATYVYGHSEPAVAGTENYPASYIFKNLDRLGLGQKLEALNIKGENCSYLITEIFVVTTDSQDRAKPEDYVKLFFPVLIEDKSILTLQTCVKGSATERLIIRAISV